MATLERIGTQIDIVGESPVWHDSQRALYWVDIRRPALRRLDFDSGRVDTWPMPSLVGTTVICDDDRLLVALSDRIALFDPSTLTFETIARPERRIEGHRFNDGRCDRQGRLWVGTMHNITRAPEGMLCRLEDTGALRQMRSDRKSVV